jgi:hypothetical protein
MNANSTPYLFQMTITNSAPRFKKDKPIDKKVQLSKELRYPLPLIIDDENNPIICVANLLSSFVILDDSDCSF